MMRTMTKTPAILQSLWVEFHIARRSKTLWITALAFLLVTIISGLFMFILQDPERARRFGLVGAKAQIFGGSANWASLFNLTLVMMSVGGLIIFGFIFVWIFGREFSDTTVYDTLSLPTSRVTIVAAKLITGAYWSMSLVLIVFILTLGVGALLQLPSLPGTAIANGLRLLLITDMLTVLLSIPFALVASIARGYLSAVGCIFLVLILGQVISQLGYGQYFPWTIPMFYSGAAEALTGKVAIPLGLISYVVVALIGFLSLVGIVVWWRDADHG